MEDRLNLVGPMREIVIRVGHDAENGPFVHISGSEIEMPTVVGGEPKVTDLPDALSFATVGQCLASYLGILHDQATAGDVKLATVPVMRA